MEKCPDCGARIENHDFEIGEIIECVECGVELQVISDEPFEVKIYEEEEK